MRFQWFLPLLHFDVDVSFLPQVLFNEQKYIQSVRSIEIITEEAKFYPKQEGERHNPHEERLVSDQRPAQVCEKSVL